MVDLNSPDSFGATVSQSSLPQHQCVSGNLVLATKTPHLEHAQSSILQAYPTPQAQQSSSMFFPTSQDLRPSSLAAAPSFPSTFGHFGGYSLPAGAPYSVVRRPQLAHYQGHFQCGLTASRLPDSAGPIRRQRTGKRRKGVQQLITAFDVLRSRLYVYPPERHLSKIETLRMAISYIHDLEDLLETADDENDSTEEKSQTSSSDTGADEQDDARRGTDERESQQSPVSPDKSDPTSPVKAEPASVPSVNDNYDLLTAGARLLPRGAAAASPSQNTSRLSPSLHSDCSELRRVLSQSSIFSSTSCPDMANSRKLGNLCDRQTTAQPLRPRHVFATGLETPLSPASQTTSSSSQARDISSCSSCPTATFNNALGLAKEQRATDLGANYSFNPAVHPTRSHPEFILNGRQTDRQLLSASFPFRGILSDQSTSLFGSSLPEVQLPELQLLNQPAIEMPTPEYQLSPEHSMSGEEMFQIIEKMLSDSEGDSFDPWLTL